MHGKHRSLISPFLPQAGSSSLSTIKNNFLNICLFALLPSCNGFEMVENGKLDMPSLQFNESCDDFDISKLCEKDCGDTFEDCSGDCESQR